LHKIEVLEAFEILLGELRRRLTEFFAQLWLSFVFGGPDDDGKAPSKTNRQPTRASKARLLPT
jgi:hypothetical protein